MEAGLVNEFVDEVDTVGKHRHCSSPPHLHCLDTFTPIYPFTFTILSKSHLSRWLSISYFSRTLYTHLVIQSKSLRISLQKLQHSRGNF